MVQKQPPEVELKQNWKWITKFWICQKRSR